MLANPVCVGYFRDRDGELVKGIHGAMIPIETWQATQRLTATRCKLQTKIVRPFPLVGLLHCGSCGTMTIIASPI